MVNLAMHNKPDLVSVFEIRPATLPNPCFSYFCRELGMAYDWIEDDGHFRVDVDAVVKSISHLEGLFSRKVPN